MTVTATAPTTKTGDLLLVRLLAPAKKRTPSEMRKSLERMLRHPFDATRWQALVDELVAGGLISLKPIQLTETGQARALEFLGLPEMPKRADWRTLRDRYLVPLALDISADAEDARKRIEKIDGLGALLLKRRHHLPAETGHTINAALGALACQRLGYPEETSVEAVRDAVLNEILKTNKLEKDQLARQLVPLTVGVPQYKMASLREAVLREWLEPTADKGGVPGGNGQLPVEQQQEKEVFDLPAFAATVEAAARNCPTGRFGDNKVFIHHVWSCLKDEPNLPVHSLDEFKQRLVEANHTGLLQLSRADLVQAMDPADVQQAETHYLGSVFHFILLQRGRP